MKSVFAWVFGLFLSLVVLVGQAQAALPTGVDTALTSIQTDAQSLAALVAPVMLAILGLVVTFKLIKRFTNKV